MPDENPREVIDQLKRWCDAQYGRRAQVARQFSVSPQLVSDWLSGKALPRIGVWLKIKEFLRKEKHKSK
jgi:transcriptional regulator with XRE-family HTH domain